MAIRIVMNFEFHFIRSKTQNAGSDGEGCCRYSYIKEHEYVTIVDDNNDN